MLNQQNVFLGKKFLPIFITQFFGAFNDNVFKNALLIYYTFSLSDINQIDSKIFVSLAAGLFILPFFLFSSLAGQIADKYEKSSLIVKIKFAEIILMILGALAFWSQNVNLLLLILFLTGVQSSFFGPLKYSILPLQLTKDDLLKANALIEAGTFLAILIGTIIGGLIITISHGILWLAAIVISAAIIGFCSSLKIPRIPVIDTTVMLNFNIFKGISLILRDAQLDRSIWFSIICISWFWFIGATFLTQFPIYTKNIIGGDEYVVTFFLTLFSIGIGLGSLICNKLLKGKISLKIVPLGAIGMTIAITLFYFTSLLYQQLSPIEGLIGIYEFLFISPISIIIVLSLLALALMAGIYIVPLYTNIQYRAAKKHVSRIIAANNILNALFMVISSLFMMFMFHLSFTVTEIFLSIAILNLVFILLSINLIKISNS